MNCKLEQEILELRLEISRHYSDKSLCKSLKNPITLDACNRMITELDSIIKTLEKKLETLELNLKGG